MGAVSVPLGLGGEGAVNAQVSIDQHHRDVNPGGRRVVALVGVRIHRGARIEQPRIHPRTQVSHRVVEVEVGQACVARDVQRHRIWPCVGRAACRQAVGDFGQGADAGGGHGQAGGQVGRSRRHRTPRDGTHTALRRQSCVVLSIICHEPEFPRF
ncbi:MAG: hypothetical protein HEQ37_18610 [Acidovorax sp.]|nr:hypothetical protein [Acidovorax sp.]